MADIVIYTSPDGQIKIAVNLAHDTIWLSQQQMADLFGTKRQAITKHLKNIFSSEELIENSVCSILEHTAEDGKTYKTKFYSLDAVISVGYRVNSRQATQFRIWATNTLKDHLIKGYTIYKPRLAQQGLAELQKTIELLRKTLQRQDLTSNLGLEAIQLILNYAKTWSLLLAYDEKNLHLSSEGKSITLELNYAEMIQAVNTLKLELIAKKEATVLFGQERNIGALQSIFNNIEQSFDSIPLYKSAEEKAAHILYFIIKDHPYIDGNKRIGCFILLLYLKAQNITIQLNDNGLLVLALLIAESNPAQKEILIQLIINILIE